MRFSKIKSGIIATTMLLVVPCTVAFGATGIIDGNGVRLRKEPSSDAKIITLLEKGKEVEILGEENGWINVKCGSNTGWVSAEYFIKNEEVTNDVIEETEQETPVVAAAVVTDATFMAVNTDVVNIRKDASTDSSVLAKVQKGQMLKVIATSEDGIWYQVKFGEVTGYIRNDLLSSDLSLVKGDGVVTGSVVNLRATASTEGEVVVKLTEGAKIVVTGAEGEWYKATYGEKSGYIHSDYAVIGSSTVTSRAGTASTKVQKVVDLAKKQLGKKYVWGGNGPSSFDCSGLVKYLYAQVGVTLNRVSSDQAKQGVAVSKSNLLPGDLVFFNGINSKSGSTAVSHVGIYIGNGEFIHAANSSRGVVKDKLSDAYYTKHYVTARRFIR